MKTKPKKTMKNPVLILVLGCGGITGAFVVAFLSTIYDDPTQYIIIGSTLAAEGLFILWWYNKMIKQIPLLSDGVNNSVYKKIKSKLTFKKWPYQKKM
jgi:hypothetical protein